MATSRCPVRFVLRQGQAGSNYMELTSTHDDYRDLLECDALHFHLRDGVDYARLETLVRELNDVVDVLAVRPR
jgi:hypothetical protein